jgi:hypothetical protein
MTAVSPSRLLPPVLQHRAIDFERNGNRQRVQESTLEQH